MLRDPFLAKIQAGKPALGMYCNDPYTADLVATLGFDWCMIDNMFTGLDFGRTEQMIRACEASGITPIVRAHTNPWLGYDHRIAVDVTRLQGIGAQYILVSHSCNKEIEECLAVSEDWHRKAAYIHPFKNEGLSYDKSSAGWEDQTKAMADQTFIIPHAESVGAHRELEATLNLPRLKMYFFAMTDSSKVLSNSKKPDWTHKELWANVDKAVRIGEKNGVAIGANTSYGYSMKEMRRRVVQLHNAGVKFIMIQGAPYMLQVALEEFLGELRTELPL
jgi:4-hydroxy-2-oxoheptanedioate aldolase